MCLHYFQVCNNHSLRIAVHVALAKQKRKQNKKQATTKQFTHWFSQNRYVSFKKQDLISTDNQIQCDAPGQRGRVSQRRASSPGPSQYLPQPRGAGESHRRVRVCSPVPQVREPQLPHADHSPHRPSSAGKT